MRLAVGGAPLAILALTACGPGTGPDLRNPASFAFTTAFVFACSEWSPGTPPAPEGLYDIRGNGASDSAMSDEALREIEALGGHIVHRYRVPMTRAVFPTRQVPRLDANFVRAVVDPERTDVEVLVGFYGPADSAVIAQHGGRVTRHLRSSYAVVALVPDAAIPALRAVERVRYVELNGVLCLGRELEPLDRPLPPPPAP